MAAEGLRQPPQAPPTFTATSSSIMDDTKSMLEMAKRVADDIVSGTSLATATFGNVVLPMAHNGNQQELLTGVLTFYRHVSTDQSLRDASTKAEKLIADYSIEASMREDVFKLVDAVVRRGDELDAESQHLLEKGYKSYVRNGLGLSEGPTRVRFMEIKKRLNEVVLLFVKNLTEEDGGLWFTKAQLHGVPDDVVSSLQTEGDKYRLTFRYPEYFPTLNYATNADVRKQVLIAFESRCDENVSLFSEAMRLRHEMARVLGYPSYAAFQIEEKLAKTPEVANKFLKDLREKFTDQGLDEIKALKALKKEHVESKHEEFDGKFYLWDYRFYDRMMEKKDHQVDRLLIAEWFPLQTTILGMLGMFERLFGLEFTEITGADRDLISPTGRGDDIVWHPDVQIFSVWDDDREGRGFIGYLYLDLFPRQGKYGHAANFTIQPGFLMPDGSRRYPATALVCNFPKPTSDKPSLLHHGEVTVLFHELGHGIHDLVSKTKYSCFHGTNTVRDFVEAPSQMLERWCWMPSQLKSLSKHYSTISPDYHAEWKATNATGDQPEEQLPDDLIQKLIKAKDLNAACFTLQQLHFGIFDMMVHGSEEKLGNISELYNRLRYEITGMEGLDASSQVNEGCHGQTTFTHLMSGYPAGYYGYLQSQVYSADMFSSFFEKDPMDPKEGKRYRYMVLEKGGSQDEMKTLRDFLGRDPEPDALYRLGILQRKR